jgi:hypothetical protein
MTVFQETQPGSGYKNDDRATIHVSHISNDSVDVADGPTLPLQSGIRVNPTIYPSGT